MASVNRGSTAYVGVTQKQVTSATTLVAPDTSRGNYSASSVLPAFSDCDRGVTIRNGIQTYSLYASVPPTVVTTYKMTGWYATGGVYESWTSMTAPNASPPSGHVLTHIMYVVINGTNAN